jgi:hypothetical protein
VTLATYGQGQLMGHHAGDAAKKQRHGRAGGKSHRTHIEKADEEDTEQAAKEAETALPDREHPPELIGEARPMPQHMLKARGDDPAQHR